MQLGINKISKGAWIVGGSLMAVVLVVVVLVGESGSGSNVQPQPLAQVPTSVELSEARCQEALKELYAVDAGGNASPTDPEYNLVRNLLQQYATDAGLSTDTVGSGTRYTMPASTCGRALGGLLKVNIQGAMKTSQ